MNKLRPHLHYRVFIFFMALVFSSSAFVILNSHAESSKLAVETMIEDNSRGSYDILVRPQESAQTGTNMNGLVQGDFLSGSSGGISHDTWNKIKNTPGVEVAAPLVNIGTAIYRHEIKIPLEIPSDAAGLRIVQSFTYDNGMSSVNADDEYRLAVPAREMSSFCGPPLDPYGEAVVSVQNRGQPRLRCFPADSNTLRDRGSKLVFPVPFSLVAVDPTEESKLSNWSEAMIDGNYLPDHLLTPVRAAQDYDVEVPTIPVLASIHPEFQGQLTYELKKLGKYDIQDLKDRKDWSALSQDPGKTIAKGVLDGKAAYESLLADMPTPKDFQDFSSRSFFDYVRLSLNQVSLTGRPSLSQKKENVEALSEEGSRRDWTGAEGAPLDKTYMPPGGDDSKFRHLSVMSGAYLDKASVHVPLLLRVGTYDPSKLVESSNLGRVPIGFEGADVRMSPLDSTKPSSEEKLSSSWNAGGYVGPGVSLITSLAAVDHLSTKAWFDVNAGATGSLPPRDSLVDPLQPISSIRVRVAGATGIGEESRERVRLAAEKIMENDDLRVDIVHGSSESQQLIQLPEGKYGRPKLTVTETWIKKGVALHIVRTLDKKSVMLGVLLLIVTVFFVLNLQLAAVRTRRHELAVRRCLGWTTSRIISMVAGEVLVLALVAGIVGVALAWVVSLAFSFQIDRSLTLMAVPVAMLIVLPGTILSVSVASQIKPMQAMQTAVVLKRASRMGGVLRLAWSGVRRDVGRSALAIAGLAISAAVSICITILVLQFNGELVGTLLGNAVSLQVRSSDLFALAGMVGMSLTGVAVVTHLNLRERGWELALLGALGWTRRKLMVLVGLEGAYIGLVGGTLGALIGAGIAIYAMAAPTALCLLLCGGVILASTALSALATVAPFTSVFANRLTSLLTEST